MIYADHSATTRLSERAFETARPYLTDDYGNASSRYSLGVRSRRAIEEARERVANAIGAEPDEIYFTSCGSEGNAWALSSLKDDTSLSLLTTSFEHSSIYAGARALERRGVDVTFLPVERSGVVSLDAYKDALRSGKRGLVSIMFANNEVGTIQPIKELCSLARRCDVLFHTDAVQAVGRIPLNVRELDVDLLTASAHKFNGPKGVGFLYKKRNVSLEPLIEGGGQERGARSGTENVFGIVAASVALEENVATLEESTKRLRLFSQRVVSNLQAELDPGDFQIVGDESNRVPGAFDILFKDADGEALTILLDMKGICVSTGSACDSVKKEPSRVLLALGFSHEEAKSAVRVSFGRENSEDDAEKVGKALAFAYRKLRRVR